MQGENIVKIIYECVNDLNYFAERRKIKFNLEIQEDFYLEVDKIRFDMPIRNLKKEVETGANGTQDYIIKEGPNKNKIAKK